MVYRPDSLTLANRLGALPHRLSGEHSTLGEIMAALDDRAVAVVLLVFSIPAIVPSPGVPAGTIFGTGLAILSLQMMAGANRFHLPYWLARLRIQRRRVEAFVQLAKPRLEDLTKSLRPRFEVLAGPCAARLLGVAVFAMAMLIVLPVPFGNTVPGIAVLLIALGLAEQDGVAIALGLAACVLALIAMIVLLAGGYWLVDTLFARLGGM
jgi:hypothetical protein